MIIATDIEWQPAKRGGFVTAVVSGVAYQKWFATEPTLNQVGEATQSFEENYAGLNEQARVPVKVKPHHTEV